MHALIFYVSTTGSDDWSGTRDESNPDGTDGPFATLTRARDAVREARRGAEASCAVSVLVRSGKYFLQETFVLTEEDSGTRECPVVYAAFPGETPVLSGGGRLTGWRTYRAEILMADFPVARDRKHKLRQLFFGGKKQMRARWPKYEATDPIHQGFLFAEGPGEPDSHDSFMYKPGSFRTSWAKPAELEVNIYQWMGCYQLILPVKSVDETNRVIRLAEEGYDVRSIPPWSWPCPFTPGDRYFMENALEELDQPGEWCIDMAEGVVYFWPPEAMTSDSEVVIPLIQSLVEVNGASYIRISGFEFTETDGGDAWHREGLDGYGAQLPMNGWKYCGEALHMTNTEHCSIEHNTFNHVGGNAVYLSGRNHKNVIRHNFFDHAGANGICLVGTRSAHPTFNRVEDNEISHSGHANKYTAGVFLGISDGNIIGHNYIHHVPHHAVNLASNGYGRNVVEYNRVEFTCLELHDNGAINVWMDELDESGQNVKRDGERAGHIIRHNFIADTIGCTLDANGILQKGVYTWGIYLDDYASNCLVYGNVIARSGVGICLHGGKNNLVENNVIVNTGYGFRPQNMVAYRLATEKTMVGFQTGNHFCRNILYTVTDAESAHLFFLHDFTDSMFARCDENLYFNAAGRYDFHVWEGHERRNDRSVYFDKGIISLDEWRELGNDLSSLTADPLFVDASRDDYALQPESPALELGFEPIPLQRIGIRRPTFS